MLTDESAVIRAGGLQPGERITIRAELTDGASQRWTSRADFMADAQGAVDVSKQAPVAGSYKEVSAMGLIWSMLPASKRAAAYRPPDNLGPQTIELRLVRGGVPVASAQIVQGAIGDGVGRIVVHDGALRGLLFTPTEGFGAGVLVVGGSYGGAPIRQAAWLASRGFAALALAYFHYEDLPANLEAIPLEYFGQALDWLGRRPEVARDRLAVMGIARGGELALQLGSMFSRIGAVVAYVPANVRNPSCCGDTRAPCAWTWQGNPLPFLSLRLAKAPAAIRDASIAVERTRGPILMVSGENDEVWRSSEMAAAVVTRLKAAHFPYEVQHLEYRNAGHAAGRADVAPAWHGTITHPVSGRAVNLGGTAKGDAHSSLDSMPRVLVFLRKYLQPESGPATGEAR